jgi:hypothetical protein
MCGRCRGLDAPADYPQHSPGYVAVSVAYPDGGELEYVFTDERVN